MSAKGGVMKKGMRLPLFILIATAFSLMAGGCQAKTPSNSAGQSANQAAVQTPVLIPFRLGHLNSTAHLLAFVAQEEGFFREEGLDAELSQLGSAVALAAALETGKLDMAFIGSVPLLGFQGEGHDLTIFGGAMTNGHGFVIKSDLVPPGYREGDISIFKGKTIATLKNSVQEYELQVLLKKEGLTIGQDVSVVYFNNQTDAYNALQSKDIDIVSVYSPFASRAKSEGHTVVYYCNEVEEFLDQPCCRQVATTDALNAHPDFFKAVERAFIRAYKFSQENHPKTIDDVMKYISLERELVEYEVYGGHSVSSPDPDKKATAVLKEGAVALGYANDYDINALYNTAIYQEALEELVKENPGDRIYRELLDHFNRYE
jgi:NitT/TauT family transport system substrate-binding protein